MARTDGLFEIHQTGYVSPIAGASLWLRVEDAYISFGTVAGASGYGFRDNGGTMQFKNELGVWTDIGTGGGGAVWGFITGTLSDQTDLITYLDTNYVPYNGASDDVNLGIHTLEAGALILQETNGLGDLITIIAPNSLTDSYTITLPTDAGTNGYVLFTDGAGVLAWKQVLDGSLTATRIPFASDSNTLTDSANLAFSSIDNKLNFGGTSNGGAISTVAGSAGVRLGRNDAELNVYIGYYTTYQLSVSSETVFGFSSTAASGDIRTVDTGFSRLGAGSVALGNGTSGSTSGTFSLTNLYVRGTASQPGEIRLYEDTDDGSNYTAFRVGTQAGNIDYVLPTAGPAVNGYILSCTTAGVMSWIANGGGSGDMVLASAQTNTGVKTFLDTTMKLRNVANTFDGYFVNTNTADRIYTLKDANGTLAFTSDIVALAIGNSITSATAGSVLFAGASGVLAQDNANFFWDRTNFRLGLRTATPAYTLDILGTSLVTAGAQFTRVSADTFSSTLTFRKARGTVGTEAVITAGDIVARIQASAYDGTAYDAIGHINIIAQGVISGVVTGAFSVSTANSAGTLVTAIYSNSDQNTGFGFTPTATSGRMTLAGNVTQAGRVNNGAYFTINGALTATDTTSSGTVTHANVAAIFSNNFAATSSTTYTNASSLYIAGTPAASTNVTITNAWAIYVNAGNSYFEGGIRTASYLQSTNTAGNAFLIYDGGANEMLRLVRTASATNEITITNAATTTAPSITATGSDTNIDLAIGAKGTGQVQHTTATYQAIVTATDGATVTFDVSDGNLQTVTLGGNRTLAISNAKVGQVFMLRLVQDGTGSRTVTWFTTIKWAGGAAPTLTTTASKADIVGFVVTSSGNYEGFVVGQNI